MALVSVTVLLLGAFATRQYLTRDDHPSHSNGLGEPVATIKTVDDQFEADTLRVRSGATIEWENEGRHTHRLVHDFGGELISSDLAPGGTERVTFEDSGDYEYYCSIHDGMTGRILVES